MKKHFSIGLSAVALAALLSGCGGSSGTTTSTTSASAAPATSAAATSAPTESSAASSSAPASAGAELMVTPSKAGQVVVDGKGMSVYFFTKDTKDSGTSACTGGCLTAWPPVFTTSETPKVDGVTGKVGTIATPDGKKQLTIGGMPVYYFEKDKAAGDILGQGVGGVWYLVAPSGEMITAPAGS
ncbi:COG4315 family predicted lipoprotein [Pseudarthrobacter sp. S9]|uniref:COG4315 family predicted lipoprotein n=1 Tax=Pseudarthrobacter sp. S9 TaxID=3418421 RepID=UPI003CFFC37D